MIYFSAHFDHGDSRVVQRMPENHNCITIRCGTAEISFFGLPTEITDLLASHFAAPAVVEDATDESAQEAA